MAATLSLDTLTSSGAGITVLAGKTLTVEGVSVTAGSTNIQRATANKTIGTDAGYEVAGKSEVVVATNAASSNRTITLPLVGATGMSTCIITVVADADATSTYKLVVQDAGTTEVWTGYAKNDFVRLIVSNSAWVVVDHKETFYSRWYLTSDQGVAGSATSKAVGFTVATEIGNAWDNGNSKLVAPFAGFWDLHWLLANYTSSVDPTHSLVPVLYVGGSESYAPNVGTDAAAHDDGTYMMSIRIKVAASTDVEFYARNLYNSAYANTMIAGATKTQFTCTFNRTY